MFRVRARARRRTSLDGVSRARERPRGRGDAPCARLPARGTSIRAARGGARAAARICSTSVSPLAFVASRRRDEIARAGALVVVAVRARRRRPRVLALPSRRAGCVPGSRERSGARARAPPGSAPARREFAAVASRSGVEPTLKSLRLRLRVRVVVCSPGRDGGWRRARYNWFLILVAIIASVVLVLINVYIRASFSTRRTATRRPRARRGARPERVDPEAQSCLPHRRSSRHTPVLCV